MNNIYSLTPVNGTAAIVTGQAECTDGRLSPKQERENLLAQVKKWEIEISPLMKSGPKRIEIGRKINEYNRRICLLKDAAKHGDITHIIIDVLKEQMTPFQWESVVKEARKRQKMYGQENCKMDN